MFKPSKEEESKVKSIVNEFLKKLKLKDTKAILGGSGAKDTWLPGTNEVDIFVKFNYNKFKNKSNKISNILKNYLKKKFKISILHGSRDYYQVMYKGFVFEIIPILDIKKASEAKNITDISPLHAKWVNKFNYKEDIRQLKLFCKANKLYGAESYIRGFSGYALEILCIYHKGFNNLIKNAVKWKSRVIIDPKKQLKDPLKELNISKIQTPIIIVDPVDKTRNVTSVVSKEKFEKFKEVCKKYLKNKSKKFFRIEKEKIPQNTIVLEVIARKGKKDVIGGKLLKAFEFLRNKLRMYGFKFDSNWIWDEKAYYWFKVKNKLNKIEIRPGPFIKDELNVKRFKKIHKNVVKKKNRYYAKVKRDFINAKDYLKFLVKKKEVKDRVKSIKFKSKGL